MRGVPIRFALALLACIGDAAFAAESTNAQMLHLTTASATLRTDAPVQKSGRFALHATLTQPDAALAASPPVQEGSGFALMATLAAASMAVCYNDTIFRDDFDGYGF